VNDQLTRNVTSEREEIVNEEPISGTGSLTPDADPQLPTETIDTKETATSTPTDFTSIAQEARDLRQEEAADR
jgi:hypothetical protein